MKFISLINLIKENHIDSSNYNLEKKYDYYNSLLFNNELPKIKLRWAALKGKGGTANCKILRKNKGLVGFRQFQEIEVVPDSMEIKMSISLKRSEQEFDKVLIHEMIHIYFFNNSMFRENHGFRFISMARKCSEKIGFDIPLTDELDSYIPNLKELTTLGVILITKPDGTYAFSILNADYLKSNIGNFSQYLTDRFLPLSITKKIELYVIKGINWTSIGLTHPIQRKDVKKLRSNLTNLSIYTLNDKTINKPIAEIINELHTHGELLNSIEK